MNDEIPIFEVFHTEKVPPEKFTCYNCKNKEVCPCAWDWYNLNGDCLMEK